MAAPGTGDPLDSKNGKAPFAQRISPTWEKLTPAQLHFMQQAQFAQSQKTLPQWRTRNIVTRLGSRALVLAIYGYTFYQCPKSVALTSWKTRPKLPGVRALERASGP